MSFNTQINKQLEEQVQNKLSELTLREKLGQCVMIEPCFLLDRLNRESNVKYDSIIDPRFLDIIFNQYHIGAVLFGGASRIKDDSAFDWATHLKIMNDYTFNTSAKVPLLYGADAVHGVNFVKGSTIFSHNLGVAATWNMKLINEYGKVVGKELSALGINIDLAPTVDVSRDQRWGRVYESLGEDPFLASKISESLISGLQNNSQVAACAKHFIGYGESSNGMDRTPSDLSERSIREIHLPPFEKAIKAGVNSIMINGADLNGTPMPAAKKLLKSLLRVELGFKGITISDWEDVYRLENMHNIATSKKDAIKKAFNAGLDMNMAVGDLEAVDIMEELVNEGSITIDRVNEACANILRVKFEIGLFEFKYDKIDQAVELCGNEESKNLATQIARESITLLKNDNNLLPLSKNLKSILITGDKAHSKRHLCGGWTLNWASANEEDLDCLTILDAIKNKVSNETKITFISDPNEITKEFIKQNNFDVCISILGEEPHSEWLGDSMDMLIEESEQLMLEKAHSTGVPMVVVSILGRPQNMLWQEKNANSILWAYLPGTEGANPISDVLFGDFCPQGKLPISIPKDANQLPMVYNARKYGYNPLNQYDPLYPFGHGLSYTSFEYSNLECNDIVHTNTGLDVLVTVKNTGRYYGKEIVQLYLKDVYASVTRPLKSLKGFTEVELEPNQSKTVTIHLTSEELSLLDEDLLIKEEARDIMIIVGNLNKTIQLRDKQ